MQNIRANLKRYLPHIIGSLFVAVLLIVVPGHEAHADGPVGAAVAAVAGSILDFGFGAILHLLSYVAYFMLTIASFGLALAAALLNLSIYLTTNLQIFIDNTPAIYQVWSILRDIASIVFIFVILWAAMQTIFDVKKGNYGTTIKNIVMVGILINFSFFFTTVFIDASNLISLQFYNAIAPPAASMGDCDTVAMNNSASGAFSGSYLSCAVNAMIKSPHGGLSDVIVNSLDVTQWYANKDQLQTSNATSKSSTEVGARLLLINCAAIVVVVLTQLSFIGAAAAAIWRICVLVLLLAFSPLWIVGYALPTIKKEVSEKWVKHLKANLIFLPVYLFLMYVAVKIISTMNLASLGVVTAGGISDATWYLPFFNLFVGFAIIIFLVNMPLVTALSFAGASGTFTEKIAKGARAWVGAKTVGRAAYTMNQRVTPWLASRAPALGALTDKGFSSISKYGWDAKKGGSYEDRMKAKQKANDELHKKIGDMVEGRGGTKAEALEAQKKYRGNLPWTSTQAAGSWRSPSALIGLMVDNRANLASAKKLNKDAEKQDKIAKKKEATEKKAELLRRLKEVEDAPDEKFTGAPGEVVVKAREASIKKKALIAEIQAKIAEQDDIIKTGKEVEDEDKLSKILGDLDTIKNKDSGGGGGGEKKEEKS